jgi:hypothetical protein
MPTTRSPLEFDVSVSAEKAQRARARRRMSGAVESSTRACEWPGCEGRGSYRAPVSPERLNEYHWFCLDHVREYNARWNFFADRDEETIEAALRSATAWERPTWRMGSGPAGMQGMHPHSDGRAWERFGISDPFELLGENATLNPGTAANSAGHARVRLTRLEQQAMDTLGLPHHVTARAEVRARYRALVKDLHPDMNGGSAEEAERLRRVLDAWDLLKASPNLDD